MLPFARPASFQITQSTPSLVTYAEGNISPKHTLNVHDLDGRGKEWTIQASVSKVSIYNSKDLTLRLPGRIITSTIEIWKCSNLKIIVGTPSSDSSNRLGTLQLDPTLTNVDIIFPNPSTIGKIVLAPLLSNDKTSFGFRGLRLQAGEEGALAELADDEGNLFDPQEGVRIRPGEDGTRLPAQLVVSFDHGEGGKWKMEGSERGAMDYPIMS